MNEPESDVIDKLAGINRGSPLDQIRAQRPQARENAQKSYSALFAPAHPGGVSAEERFALATFVAGLHRDATVYAFYQAELTKRSDRPIAAAIEAAVKTGAAHGPYGGYPRGPLSDEDKSGPTHRISEVNRPLVGARLSAALEHAHLLVFHPRDANAAALQSLLDAGWSTTDVVTISQLIAFLSFQIRVIVGLRGLAAASAGP
jgi:CMD domain protein